jgi:hypothetical protein
MKFDLLIENILQQLNENTAIQNLLSFYNEIKTDALTALKNLRGEERLEKLKFIRKEIKKELIRSNFKNIDIKDDEEKEVIVDSALEFIKNKLKNDSDDFILNKLKSLHQVAYTPPIISNILKKPERPKMFYRPKGW